MSAAWATNAIPTAAQSRTVQDCAIGCSAADGDPVGDGKNGSDAGISVGATVGTVARQPHGV